MKSREYVNISTRKQRDKTFIYLRKTIVEDGRKIDKRISTGLEATKENLAYVKKHGVEIFNKAIQKVQEECVLLKDFYKEALDFISLGVTAETKQRRESNFRDSILPYLGNRNILNISPYDIENWQQLIYAEKGSDYTSRLKSLLKRVFNRAVVKGIIASNPCEGTAPIKRDKKQRRDIYTKAEIELMLKEADEWMRAFVLVYATLGLRTGEIVGLKFSDVLWDIAKLHLQRSIRHGKISPPKTGERYIDIPTKTLETLKELKAKSQSEWIFPNKKGDHYHDGSSINAKKFQPFLEKIGVEYKSLYSLRHFYATYTLNQGQDLAYLSKQIGHSNIKTTLDFYVGYLPNAKNKQKQDEIFNF